MLRTVKYTIIAAILLFFAAVANAQAPQGIPYQAVARDNSGAILANQAISLRFTIHDTAATGTELYRETFAPTTNSLGLFNVNVGTGTVVTGTFSNIIWGVHAKYLEVEMDPAGGTSYLNMGATQMMSVPYAIYSNMAGNGMPAGITTGDMLYWNGINWVRLAAGTNGQVLTMSGGQPAWTMPYTFSMSIGTSYQGGILAYILQPGDPGYDPVTPHGLIAAPSDQSTGIQWYNGSHIAITATGTAIGTGFANTYDIIAGQGAGSYAASICANLTLGGYTDWYLPSANELAKLYLNKTAIGGFTGDSYWSSSWVSAGSGSALFESFSSGGQPNIDVAATLYVRAIRSF